MPMAWQGSQLSPTTSSHAITAQAMRVSAVSACLRLLSEAVATLPLDTFYRQGGIRRPFRPRPEYLSFAPPRRADRLLLADHVVVADRRQRLHPHSPRRLGVPTDLVVLDPTMVNVTRNNGRVRYVVVNQQLDPTYDIMHIKGMMQPGA